MRDAYRAYSKLNFDKAWYEFSFLPWVESVWSTTPFFGTDFIRKNERKLFFTLEFVFKTMYAEAIGYASKNTFDPSTGKIYMTINRAANSKPLPAGVDVMESRGLQQLVSLPRWQGFTETLPALTAAGYSVEDISGNPMIAASIIVPSNAVDKLPTGSYWFTSRIVSDTNHTRIVMPVAVKTLHTFLAELPASNAKLEHLYDF